jgi:BASS family bile acid:Na+ symporter
MANENWIKHYLRGKSGILFLTIGVGLLVPWGHHYSYLLRYVLMAMLFLSWIDCGVPLRALTQPRLWGILVAMAGVAIASFGGLMAVDLQLALVALLLAMTPTALAAPVVTGLLKGRVEFVTASVLLTNSLSVVVVPVLLLLLPHPSATPTGWPVLLSMGTVIALPLGLSQLLRSQLPLLAQRLKRAQPITFYLWLVGLYLASAKVGHFIRTSYSDWTTLLPMALVAGVLCAVNFSLGRWLGRPGLIQESGQALGQKNTLLAVWICLTFLNPTLALGPMFYILFQNLYNAYLLAQAAQR